MVGWKLILSEEIVSYTTEHFSPPMANNQYEIPSIVFKVTETQIKFNSLKHSQVTSILIVFAINVWSVPNIKAVQRICLKQRHGTMLVKSYWF